MIQLSWVSWSALSPSLLKPTFLQGSWHAFEGFGTRLTLYLCRTSGHELKLQKILRQGDSQSRKERHDLLPNKFD
jgi:hypothetical protein